MTQNLRLLPTDILEGVLAHLYEDNLASIPTSKEPLHSAFYKSKMQGVKLLEDFSFDTSGTFPYSPMLEQATSNLATCLLLERNNPKLNAYLLTERLHSHFESDVGLEASLSDIQAIDDIANVLRSELASS